MCRFIKHCDGGDKLGKRSSTFDTVHTVTVQRADSSLAFRKRSFTSWQRTKYQTYYQK